MKSFQNLKDSECTNDFTNIRHLVFAGGGIRGVAFIGALKSIYDKTGIDFSLIAHKPLSSTGVSVGALLSLLIVTGYSVHELLEFSTSLLSESFVSIDPLHLLKGGLSVDNGEKLKVFLVKLLQKKGFSEHTTLLQLTLATKVMLETVVTNLTTASVHYVSSETFPDLPVITAVTASMSLPLIFPPVRGANGHLWADGGVLENFPIRKYDADYTLGFTFLWKIDGKPDSLLSYIMRLIQLQQIPSEICSWNLMSKKHKKRTIVIDCGGISLLGPNWDFALTIETMQALLHIGKRAAEEKMKSWHSYVEVDADPGSRLPSVSPRTLPSFLPVRVDD
jgi:predicted acylesterase/phospholipase RssA